MSNLRVLIDARPSLADANLADVDHLADDDEIMQLTMIWRLCGTPTPQSWPSVTQLPDWPAQKDRIAADPKPRILTDRYSSK